MPFSFEKDFLILCEGTSDREFLRTLMRHKGIDAAYQTIDPTDLGLAGGNTQWAAAIAAIVGTTDFQKLKGLVIVPDNDQEPSKSVGAVKKALRNAPPFDGPPRIKLAVPHHLMKKTNTEPRVGILPIPAPHKRGCLETLCLGAAKMSNKQLGCINAFLTCADWQRWSISRRDKMKLRLLIAMKNTSRRDVQVWKIWRKMPNLVPIASKQFDQISDFLDDFRN